jgi:hypothetical protein
LKARNAFAACAMLTLAACAFSSARPFFDARDAASPFAEGRYEWREQGDTRTIVLRRDGAAYVVRPDDDNGERPMLVLFAAVPETPEDDYIVQVQFQPDIEARAYAFMWPHEAGYRLIAAPSVIERLEAGSATLDARCAKRPMGECQLDGRADLLALYRETVYPRFVTGSVAPSHYMDITPAYD